MEKTGTYIENEIHIWGWTEERRSTEYKMAKLEPNLFNP